MTEKLRQLAIWLGCLSSVGLVLSHLALTDIHHGDADLTLEWSALRIAFGIMIAFHVAALLALRRRRPGS